MMAASATVVTDPDAPDTDEATRNGDGHLVESEIVLVEEQAPVKRGADAPGAESWLIALFFGVVYGLIGYFMLTDGRIVNFDALHNLNAAYMTWWNSPPKLAAIPLDTAPLGAIAFLPLTLIKPIATTLISLPVITAIAAGLLMALVNSIMYRCEFPTLARYILLVLFGLNPVFVFYAGNGDVTMIGMMFAAIALVSLISWRIARETRYLALAGLAMGVAVMFDYGYALWAVGITIGIMFVGNERDDGSARMKSALIVFLAPVIYALMVWILINTVLLGSPFGWLTAQTGFIEVNTTGALQAITSSPGTALGDLVQVVLGVAPLGFATVILLLLAAIFQRNGLAWGLFLLTLFAVAVPVTRVLVADQADLMDLSVGLPLALLAFAGAAWVYWSQESWRVGMIAIMGIGLIAALPLGWSAMQDYQFQNQAQAFTRWIEDRESQEGTTSVGGYTVGIDPELAMATYVNNELPQEKNSILVDENFSYGPMILSGRPTLFLDRADSGEGEWEATRDNPFGEVSYMLIATNRGGDQIRKEYPNAIFGGAAGLEPIFRTERYTLLEVAESRPTNENQRLNDDTAPQSTPRPFTPESPPDASGEGDSSTAPQSTPPDDAGTTAPAPTPAPSPSTGQGNSSAPRSEGE